MLSGREGAGGGAGPLASNDDKEPLPEDGREDIKQGRGGIFQLRRRGPGCTRVRQVVRAWREIVGGTRE